MSKSVEHRLAAQRKPVERTLAEMLRDPGTTQFGVGEPWQHIDKWAEALVRRAAEIGHAAVLRNAHVKLAILADAGLEVESE